MQISHGMNPKTMMYDKNLDKFLSLTAVYGIQKSDKQRC